MGSGRRARARRQTALAPVTFKLKHYLDVFDLEHLLSYDRVGHGGLRSSHRHQKEGRQHYKATGLRYAAVQRNAAMHVKALLTLPD